MTPAEMYRRMVYCETLERLTLEREQIMRGLLAMGHNPDAGVMVEQALEWLLRQPAEGEA